MNKGKREEFRKKYGLLLIAAAFFTVYTVCLSALVAHRTDRRVTEEVTEAVTTELRTGFQEYLDQMEEERNRTAFLTGDDSRQAAIESLKGPLAEHAAGLRMDRKVTAAGAETYLYVDCARWLSGTHGETIEDVLNETGPNGVRQIEAYTPGHATRNEDGEIAERVATAIITGHYPDGFTTELQYAEINADGSVTARDKWKTDSTTVFWRIR